MRELQIKCGNSFQMRLRESLQFNLILPSPSPLWLISGKSAVRIQSYLLKFKRFGLVSAIILILRLIGAYGIIIY